MAGYEDDSPHERIFTLTEAMALIPQLETHLSKAKQGKTILSRTKEEIQKASANAEFGGGSVVGPRYIEALEEIHESLQAIHELGVIVKDIDIGLCDFPYLLNGRIVYLCWKLGEDQIEWWHEIDGGYAGRQALPK